MISLRTSAALNPRTRQLGIVGGMGPLAGAEFFRRFTAAYPAKNDQQHPVVHLYSDPSIESRSDAILSGDTAVGAKIRISVERLIDLGADVIAVPCNTAHHFIDEFRGDVFDDRTVLAHIVDATLDQLEATGQRTGWLLATQGTISSGIYSRHAEARGLALHLPDAALQHVVTQTIEAVKAGDIPAAAISAERLADQLGDGAAAPLLAACTELPIAFEAIGPHPLPHISSIDALVGEAIRLVTAAA